MRMIIRISWLNVWRQRVRSLVVITAISLGLWAGLFISAFVRGMMEQKIQNVIDLELADVQAHKPGFRDEYLSDMTLPDAAQISAKLRDDKRVRAVTERVLVNAMVASSNHSGGARVMGVDREDEMKVSIAGAHMKAGSFLEGEHRNPIVISARTAEKYKVDLRSKLVLTFQDVNREMTHVAFRVCGIYDSGNPMFDEAHIYVNKSDLQNHLSIGNNIHEIAAIMYDHNQAESLAASYAAEFPGSEIMAWLDLSPGMRFMITAMDTYMYMIVGIILLALLFSIVNTMLMAVLERARELGMLMAVGMTRTRVFLMIMLETIFLGMAGGPAGLLLAWSTISWFGRHGLNLGSGAAYGDFGFSNIIYPALDTHSYMEVTFMVLTMSVLAAIYPAWKALQLNPIEAIRQT
ncbi:MAG: ABC transporter permease [Flavobacteriales bacterium]|nr:ABC transporter permease [Flavobacteriales bacterium]MCB9447495.1 ABC transporter permease [Flavobacteriales bacterium]